MFLLISLSVNFFSCGIKVCLRFVRDGRWFKGCIYGFEKIICSAHVSQILTPRPRHRRWKRAKFEIAEQSKVWQAVFCPGHFTMKVSYGTIWKRTNGALENLGGPIALSADNSDYGNNHNATMNLWWRCLRSEAVCRPRTREELRMTCAPSKEKEFFSWVSHFAARVHWSISESEILLLWDHSKHDYRSVFEVDHHLY